MRTTILLALVVFTAGCAAAGTATPPTPTPTPTSTVARVKLDAHARKACSLLDSAAGKRADDPIGANQDEFSAVTEVKESHIAGLRKIEARYDALAFDKAAPKLRAWCHAHAPN